VDEAIYNTDGGRWRNYDTSVIVGLK